MKNAVRASLDLPSLQATFAASIQPRLLLHARIHFYDKCAQTKADKVAEATALAWKWFVRLAERGKDAQEFVMVLADYAVRAVKNGRRVTGMSKAKDVMTERTQRRHGFKVKSLAASTRSSHASRCSAVGGQRFHDTWEERLQDNTMTPVPEQVAFRIDWPAWLQTRTNRDRRIINDLVRGERTSEVSRKHGLSPGRISQLRLELHDDWEAFCSLPEEMRHK